jgi:hypothetical protein
MQSRPVPHLFRVEQTAAITSLYERRGPAVLERLLRSIKAPTQPLNKTSRLGWPFLRHVDPDVNETKRDVLMPFFQRIEQLGAAEALEGCFIVMNVRLQAEAKAKVRSMLFVNDQGNVYEKEVNEKARVVETPFNTKRVASRTRLVFNMPCANLYKQVLDTAIHNALLTYPAFHHNMYAVTGLLPVRGDILFFDVKHFERHTASIARRRAELIGGLYGEIVHEFNRAAFLCPSDTWDSAHYLWPDRAAGWSDQFASGDSAVAPLQKEIFICLYQEVAEKILRVPKSASMDWVFQGGDERITIRNYGDDNALSGDGGALEEAFHLLKEYLEVEKEDPPKFLGFLYTKDGWRLGVESYLTKTYLNERKPYSGFRKYPLFGWVEKRNVYRQYGVAQLDGEVFPLENKKLEENGHPWSRILLQAQKEAVLASTSGGIYKNPAWLLDKDYQMDADEKLESGLFEGIFPQETKPMIDRLLGPQWKGALS